MPELPEVETVKRGIAPLLEGRKIVRVVKRRPDLRIAFPDDFETRIEGRLVEKVDRRAKYLLIYLAGTGPDRNVLICHLGMSGKINLKAARDRKAPKSNDPESYAPESYEKHDHVIFETDRGDLIIYNDPRRFGLMTLCPEKDLDQHRFFKAMGPEPLGNGFDGPFLRKRLENKKTPIKSALLDQRVVVGLGNIYVCEALFEAGISPFCTGAEMAEEACEKLVPIIRDVLRRAIEAGGSTLKDYARVDGELGYFQHQFKVYGREGESCIKEDCTGVIERQAQSGRSTFYCPHCQP